MKENNSLIQKSKLMIGLFSFLGIMMVFAIVTTNLTSKGTYSYTASTCPGTIDNGKCCTCSKGSYSNGKCTWSETVRTPNSGDCQVTSKTYSSYQCYKNVSLNGVSESQATTYRSVGYECVKEGIGSTTYTCTKHDVVNVGATEEENYVSLGYECTGSGEIIYYSCTQTANATCTNIEETNDACYRCASDADEYTYVWKSSAGGCSLQSAYTTKNTCEANNQQQSCQYSSAASCRAAFKGYNCYEDPNNNGCYIKSTNACYACTKNDKTYYTYTNEGGCPLADNYERCAVDTKGKNRLYLMQYDRSTGSTSTINVLECNYDAVEECTVNPGGTWYHEKECIRNVGNTTNVTINGDTTWWTCVGTPSGGGSGGDNPPASGTTPSNPSSSEKKTCYVCVSGEKSQYVWASSSANAASAATTLTGITSKNCATTSESNCSGIPVTNCYECNGSKKYVMADSDADAKSKSGGSSCTIVTTDKCNTVTPPATGTVGIIVAWIIGILTIGYSMWYFKKVHH